MAKAKKTKTKKRKTALKDLKARKSVSGGAALRREP